MKMLANNGFELEDGDVLTVYFSNSPHILKIHADGRVIKHQQKDDDKLQKGVYPMEPFIDLSKE